MDTNTDTTAELSRVAVLLDAAQAERDRVVDICERHHALWFLLYRKDRDQALIHFEAYGKAQERLEDLSVEIARLAEIGQSLLA